MTPTTVGAPALLLLEAGALAESCSSISRDCVTQNSISSRKTYLEDRCSSPRVLASRQEAGSAAGVLAAVQLHCMQLLQPVVNDISMQKRMQHIIYRGLVCAVQGVSMLLQLHVPVALLPVITAAVAVA
jgi:hypothetical protein